MFGRLSTVLFACIACAMSGCAAPHDFTAPGHARIEFRFAEDSPQEGTTPARLAGSDTVIHLHGNVEFSNRDLAGAKAIEDNVGHPALALIFTSEASKKLADVTAKNIGKKLAIVLDGDVLSAPILQGVIDGGEAIVTGDFTAEDVRKYVYGLHGRPTERSP